MQDSEAFGKQVRTQGAGTLAGQVLSVETYEVVAEG
jgi:hypothetical protein